MVLRHGSLATYSSQGVERLHQWVQFITQYRSNRKTKDVAATVLTGVTAMASNEAEKPGRRKRGRENRQGGHMSNKDRDFKLQRTDELKAAIKTKQEVASASSQ